MAAAWTIAKREFKTLLVSPMPYVVIGIFAFVAGIHFLVTLQNFDMILQRAELQSQFAQDTSMFDRINLNEMLIAQVVSFAFFLFIFAVPALTAPSIAEERKQGTYELLFTSPVSTWSIIFGKFMANLGLFLLLASCHALFLAVMFLFGNPEAGPVLSAYLGLLLFGAVLVAIGVFASSLTSNTVVAYFIALLLSLGLLMIGWGAKVAPGNLATFLEQAALDTHFQNFNKGVIAVSGLTYFITLAMLFWAATNVSIESLTRK